MVKNVSLRYRGLISEALIVGEEAGGKSCKGYRQREIAGDNFETPLSANFIGIN